MPAALLGISRQTRNRPRIRKIIEERHPERRPHRTVRSEGDRIHLTILASSEGNRPASRAAMSSGPASSLPDMETERVTATTTIESAPEAVFAVLADPSAHADIDGTGWVRVSLDGDRITAAGQVFRIAMYHENHPDGDYKIANQVEVFDEPRAIAWQPGTESPETGELSFGGWIWRYDLEATGPSRTTVTLTYDWSAVPPEVREYIQFPPFGPDHLDNSLQHLSDLVAEIGR